MKEVNRIGVLNMQWVVFARKQHISQKIKAFKNLEMSAPGEVITESRYWSTVLSNPCRDICSHFAIWDSTNHFNWPLNCWGLILSKWWKSLWVFERKWQHDASFSLTFLCLMDIFQTPKTHPDIRNPVNTLGPAKPTRKNFFVAGGRQHCGKSYLNHKRCYTKVGHFGMINK